MKNTLIILSSILLIAFVGLSFLDNSDYGLERQLWYLQKEFDHLTRDPQAVPASAFDHLQQKYQNLAAQAGKPMQAKILMQRGQLYLLQEDFAKAREFFRRVTQEYAQNEGVQAEALFYQGLTHEKEGLAAEAFNIYKEIQERYPLTVTGMNIPLYIANYHLKRKEEKQAAAAFKSAEAFYTKIHGEYSTTAAGYMALRLLATVHLAQADWEEALGVLERLLLEYPSTQSSRDPQAVLLIRTINAVALNQLNQPERARKIYEKFIDQFPQHPLNKALKTLLPQLKPADEKTSESAE